MNLYLIRHGHTTATDGGMAAGRTDVPLNARGRQAVSALGSRLQSLLPASDIHWWASPLLRTRETADLLQAATSVAPVALDERLVELDFGEWEGRPWTDIHREHAEAMSHWAEDWINRAPPGGESFAGQQARCEDWLTEWQARQVAEPPRHTIVVAHGGTLRALLCSLLKWPARRAMSFSVDPASLFQCRYDAEAGVWRAVWFNETGQCDTPAASEKEPSTSATRSSSQ